MDNYVVPDQGMVSHERIDRRAALFSRLAKVEELDTRHKRLLDAGDYPGLLALADEYHNLGAVSTAARIRIEAG